MRKHPGPDRTKIKLQRAKKANAKRAAIHQQKPRPKPAKKDEGQE